MQTLSPMRLIAAALFALSALLGTPSVQDESLAIGTPAAAAQEPQTEPRYWQMYYNFAPPTDAFIAELAAEQGVAYTPGKKGEARFYADDGRPIYPSNDGAVGVIVTVTLPAGDVLTRYGNPNGRYVSPDGMTFEQRALPSTTREGDFHVYLVERAIDNVQKGTIAPWFGRTGGGIQYRLPDRIVNLMNAAPPFLSEPDEMEEQEAA
ncbi:TNT domain-containing protein [Selenomonas dianae]|uniref:TNT domain-containing protein n=1 Tax=Selenomonas dianae TaxID=135079 RepID=A0ABN0T7E7_9FIRM|nr:TNT domain-containing protein [Selenomonas dianae]WLD82428.1 TNT domain-containing protein [Selenomonas dianae]